MSGAEPHETDCSEVLDHLYEYLDREMPDGDCAKFEEHFDECSPCLEKYGLEQEVKKLVKRCCGQDDVPSDLRSKVMGRIANIREYETEGAQGGGAAAEASDSASGTATGPGAGSASGSAAASQREPESGAESSAVRKRLA